MSQSSQQLQPPVKMHADATAAKRPIRLELLGVRRMGAKMQNVRERQLT